MPAEVIATAMVLQALQGLSDREAISALRRDIAWMVVRGRGLRCRPAQAAALGRGLAEANAGVSGC